MRVAEPQPAATSLLSAGPAPLFGSRDISDGARGVGLRRLRSAAGGDAFSIGSRSHFRRRAPGPPPLRSMKTTPAASRADRRVARLLAGGMWTPRSKRVIVDRPMPEALERSGCDQSSSALAARHCSAVIVISMAAAEYSLTDEARAYRNRSDAKRVTFLSQASGARGCANTRPAPDHNRPPKESGHG